MQQITNSFTLAFNYLPQLQRIMLWLLLIIVTLVIVIWQPYHSSTVEQLISSIVSPRDDQLQAPILKDNKLLHNHTQESNVSILRDGLKGHLEEKTNIHTYTISNGDTLSAVLTRYGINIADITVLANHNTALCNLKRGQFFSWVQTVKGNLQRLKWDVSCHEARIYNRINNNFKENIINITGEWRNVILTGQLNGSFITSARTAGLTWDDINAVIKALQWQLDFCKLHQGDQFSVLTLREMMNGKSAQSKLLGVRLHTNGKDYYAFRADNGNFYNRNAIGLAHGFMRFPTVKQFRISSNFNLHRLNPITGQITPHRGIDFAVPVGTPVLAVSDGKIIISKQDSIAGNYVAIRHDHQYMTRYMHLKKLLVKPGQIVKCGDCIALSGNTGRSTGPHLHYEVWINQQAVNPMTANLPYFENLTRNNRAKYLANVHRILLQLQLK